MAPEPVSAQVRASPREIADAIWLSAFLEPEPSVPESTVDAHGDVQPTRLGPVGPAATEVIADDYRSHPEAGERPAEAPGTGALPRASDGMVPARSPRNVDMQPSVATFTEVSAPDRHEVVGVQTAMAGAYTPVTLSETARGMARALASLRQTVSSAINVDLDEEATAERLAGEALAMPVHRARLERRWDMTLVIDTSTSMHAWRDEAARLVAALERCGVFRDVHHCYVDTDVETAAELRLRGSRTSTGTRSPDLLVRPGRDHVVWIYSDTLGRTWRSHAVFSLLWRWAGKANTAVLTPINRRMWHNTNIRSYPMLGSAGPGPAPASGMSWSFRQSWDKRLFALDVDIERARPIPVLEQNRYAVEKWARALAGRADGRTELPVMLVPPVTRTVVPAETADTDATRRNFTDDAGWQQVAAFHNAATSPAFDLATHLAAAPLTWSMIDQVIAMTPGADRRELSELFMHGLLTRTGPSAAAAAGHVPGAEAEIVLDFLPGVRANLLAFGRQRDTIRVLKAVCDHLGPDIAMVRHLRQAIDSPGSAPIPEVTPSSAPFLAVEETALSALSGPFLARARRIQEHFVAAADKQHILTSTQSPTVVSNMPSVTTDISAASGTDGGDAISVPPPPRAPTDGDDPDRLGDSQLGGNRTHLKGDVLTSTTETSTAKQQQARQHPVVFGNVPQRNPYFTGRNGLLRELHTRLGHGTTAVLPEALHGMGGVGKSQLAVEYVYRHQADYDIVWWIPAEHSTQIGKALAELAQRLGLSVGGEANTAVPAVREALRIGVPYDNWLLVFDNAEDPRVVREYFPQGGNGKILVTSRNAQWSSIARPLEVDVFSREESVELLQKRDIDLTENDAGRLARALGDLPLAVEQAATWRAETGMSADEYLTLFEEKREELLGTSPPMDYEVPVQAAWNLSLDRLADRNPAALRLLQVCSFFAPEPIPRQVFRRGRNIMIMPELDAALRDPFKLNMAIREITRYALARVDHRTNSLQMHRLVQTVLRGRMTPDERETMRHGAHLLLAANDPDEPSNPENWEQYSELYPHVIASEAIGSRDPFVRDLLVHEVDYLFRWGDHEGSLTLAQQTYDAWTGNPDLGEEDPHSITMAGWVGWVSYISGRFAEAARVNKRLLELCEQVHGDNHTETLEALGNVGADRVVAGDFEDSLRFARERHRRAVRAYGPGDTVTLDAAHNVGLGLRLLGRFQEARELDQETWERRVQLVGEDNIESLRTYSNLLVDERELGDYQGVRIRLEDVVERVRRLVKNIEDHPELLRVSGLLAIARRKSGDHDSALELSRDVERRSLRRYSKDYPRTIGAALALSIDLRHAGELAEAHELCEATRRRFDRAFGAAHPHTLAATVDLGVISRLAGDLETASELSRTGLDGLRGRLGEDHAHTMIAATNLASDRYALGEFQIAHDMDVATLERSRRILGENHPSTLACASNLALDLRALGEDGPAENLLADTVVQLDRVLGKGHPATRAAASFVRADCDIDPFV
ncbi:FxSxx-COOH system tetratricopeptide repeat protein [Frankia sp. Mgl5]|uniref:FxSxx-COOH system tetratricopeptide repeat protein n=1 Tax=Frankia sp. Mgl5 TaxID=2933793 RepID=UPI00200EC441|nr:FxSxx-COOH system tetratricopeptide repeat protein [Frankia sp. Mgl5]MCK9925919.1 FxSxx-COOH system tetratricopeptide repeat protein [Frankia sp. Mgl5]